MPGFVERDTRYVVGALHPAPREVLMVGLASGSWAQVVAHLPGVERFTIIEINPGYVDDVSKHPETRSRSKAARSSIARRPEHLKLYENLLGFNDMEYRPTILDRTSRSATVITDDNMVVEWREPLRWPERE